ncbi:MAG: NAD(P)-dependent oxidoreductase, partial [Chloroflexota bacterium]|nr:NAD(P)-dependent oxidoreductase [Chloroflexota bacterium]
PEGILSAVRAGQTLVDHGTTGIALTQELARRAESLGARLLDAPISGGVAGAEAATLSIMVGGDRQVFEAHGQLFQAIGKTIRYVGPSGSGQALKLANQLLVIVHQLAAVEAFALAEKAGVSADVFGEIIPNSWGQSRMLELILPRLVKRSFGDSGPSLWSKDEQLIEEAAAGLHQPIPMLQAARKLLDQGIAAGLGMADLAAALQIYEAGSGGPAA